MLLPIPNLGPSPWFHTRYMRSDFCRSVLYIYGRSPALDWLSGKSKIRHNILWLNVIFPCGGAFIPMITIHDTVLSIYQTYIHLGKARGRSNCCAGFCCNRSNCQYTYDQWCKQRLHRTTKRLKVRDLLFSCILHCTAIRVLLWLHLYNLVEWMNVTKIFYLTKIFFLYIIIW